MIFSAPVGLKELELIYDSSMRVFPAACLNNLFSIQFFNLNMPVKSLLTGMLKMASLRATLHSLKWRMNT